MFSLTCFSEAQRCGLCVQKARFCRAVATAEKKRRLLEARLSGKRFRPLAVDKSRKGEVVTNQRGKTMIENMCVSEVATIDRRVRERRQLVDRRNSSNAASYSGEERRKGERRKVERRRLVDPTTCERDYTADEIEFMKAMDDYKRRSGRQFPTWSEVLEVLRSLGYRKVAPPSELKF